MYQHVSASRWLALPAASVALIVSGFTVAPATADPGNGQGATVSEQARAGQAPPSHAAASSGKASSSNGASSSGKAPTKGKASKSKASTSGGAASSGHDDRWQAQADPDGDENGGVDQPGGTGGTIGAQDGDNGSGNDIDCEDDNNGITEVPGHCPEDTEEATVTATGTGDDTNTEATSTETTSTESTSTGTTSALTIIEMTATEAWATVSTSTEATTAGAPDVEETTTAAASTPGDEVLGVSMSQPSGASEVAPAAAFRAAPSWGLAGILPQTGAARYLTLLGLGGAAATLAGSLLLRRRAVRG